MSVLKIGDDVFEMIRSEFEVTSLHRPDTTWRFTDAAGHTHRWWDGTVPADGYYPDRHYITPTLEWVKTGEEWWDDDDEPHDVGHLACVWCKERVEPSYCADGCTQYVPGLKRCTINGRTVSPEEFERQLREATTPSNALAVWKEPKV